MMLKRDIDGGLSFVQMLNRSNILVFVGSGENEDDYPGNKLFFWNEKEQATIDEIEMDNRIITAKITKHMLIVSDSTEVRGIKLPTNVPFFSLKPGGGLNSRGLFANSIPIDKDGAMCVAAPHEEVGKIKV
jgi:hypothetical protein